jgi:hypothetical protein
VRVLHDNPEMPTGTIAARTVRDDFVFEPANFTFGIFKFGANSRTFI